MVLYKVHLVWSRDLYQPPSTHCRVTDYYACARICHQFYPIQTSFWLHLLHRYSCAYVHTYMYIIQMHMPCRRSQAAKNRRDQDAKLDYSHLNHLCTNFFSTTLVDRYNISTYPTPPHVLLQLSLISLHLYLPYFCVYCCT